MQSILNSHQSKIFFMVYVESFSIQFRLQENHTKENKTDIFLVFNYLVAYFKAYLLNMFN